MRTLTVLALAALAMNAATGQIWAAEKSQAAPQEKSFVLTQNNNFEVPHFALSPDATKAAQLFDGLSEVRKPGCAFDSVTVKADQKAKKADLKADQKRAISNVASQEPAREQNRVNRFRLVDEAETAPAPAMQVAALRDPAKQLFAIMEACDTIQIQR